jgi:hypothetical protein
VQQMKQTAAPFLSYVPLAEKRPGITSLRSTFLRGRIWLSRTTAFMWYKRLEKVEMHNLNGKFELSILPL